MSAWDVSDFDNWKPSDYTQGMIGVEAGNSMEYFTGGWRSDRPVWDADACKQCLLCWMHCPDNSIIVLDAKMTGIDYDHCKGCGVCVHECKFGALEMIPESQAEGGNHA